MRQRIGIGGYCILELASQVQSHHYQIINPSAQPVPHAIFGYAGGARMVDDGDFLYLRAGVVCEYRQKPMQPIKRRDALDDPALENAQIATGVGKIDSEDQASSPARDA